MRLAVTQPSLAGRLCLALHSETTFARLPRLEIEALATFEEATTTHERVEEGHTRGEITLEDS